MGGARVRLLRLVAVCLSRPHFLGAVRVPRARGAGGTFAQAGTAASPRRRGSSTTSSKWSTFRRRDLHGVVNGLAVRRGASLSTARKTPIIGGLLLSTVMIGANFTDDPKLVVMFMTLAFFANGLASITWSLVSSVAPERLIGLSGGVFNFIGGLAFVTVPIAIGFLAKSDSSTPALTLIVILALMGALSYIFLVGKVERVSD